jgi:hypothetical protein
MFLNYPDNPASATVPHVLRGHRPLRHRAALQAAALLLRVLLWTAALEREDRQVCPV